MTQTQPTLQAAVIGLGFIGAADQVSGDAIGQQVANLDGTHAQALAAHPRVKLAAGSSRNKGRRTRFEERMPGTRTYADWREMLAAEKLDIVSIATNSPYHAEITIACSGAGVRAVLCEKPIATSLSDADRAIAACRRSGTILAVNHQRRWHPLWRSVRDEICAGTIGEVRHAVVHWTGGRMGNVGTHWFDTLRMLLGTEAEAVSGTLDPEVGPDCRGAEFHDPGGWGVVSFAGGLKAFIHGAQASSLPLVIRVAGALGQVTVRGNEAVVETWDGKQHALSTPADRPSSIEAGVRDIVECLDTGAPPASTGEDGLAALEIIIGFHVSDRLRGQWVPLPITGADRDLDVPIG